MKALHCKIVTWILILCLGMPFLPPPAQATPPPLPLDPAILRKIEPTLLKEMERLKGGSLPFIVHLQEEADLAAATRGVSASERQQAVVRALQATAERSQARLKTYLAQQKAEGKVERYTPYWVFNGLAVHGDRDTLLALAAQPEVKVIRADHKRYLTDDGWRMANDERQKAGGDLSTISSQPAAGVEWNVAKIRADRVWDALDVDGTGVVVANMDTGVDWGHPALLTRYRGYDPHGLHRHLGNWYCATDEGYLYPGDGHGHGTHTMGTIVGGGQPAIGVAPGARWIAVKIFHNQGYAYDSWIHTGFQWLLDPDGNSGTDDAPDAVNNSWGSDYGSLETFRPDVQALRAAGIFPVFSSGNAGPWSGTVGSPASYPESFAVGATDRDDYIASFSSRGPSPWHEIKPEVSAPGMDVRSSVPGGGYKEYNGTSMAAPHVTGLTALLLQAQPGLTVTETEAIITSTALALGSPFPNNDYGWGRIDAFNAVAAVAHPGFITGTVTRATDGAPLAGANVSATPHAGGPAVKATADGQGRYSLALAPNIYDLRATAFAYEPSTAYHVIVVTDTTTVQDFALSPSPVGTLVGRVMETGTGTYLSATIIISGTPATAVTDPATGLYNVVLPAGTYDVRAESPGHRVGWAYGVAITIGQAITRDFILAPAPTILLIDSGAWYGGSEISYFQQALNDLNYLYDIWTIRRPFERPNDVPTATDLLPYEIVIWSSPQDSPGYVGAWRALAGYLDAGGRLFLTGQDIGYWDDGGNPFYWAPQYRDYLKASYVKDDAGPRDLTGINGDIFDGLALTVEGGDGADNQDYPDEIAVADADHATSIIRYKGDGSGGQRVGLCLPYRALYLSFGFEAINRRDIRREVMERTIDWLISPRQKAGVELSPQIRTEIGLPQTTVTHTLRLRNSGEMGTPDVYSLTVIGHAWPTTLLTETVPLSSCASTDIGLQVGIPAGTGWDISDTAILTACSTLSPALIATATLQTKTPAPILLVDDDRWYNVEEHFQDALESNGYPYDYWEVGWDIGDALGSPPLEILQRYPIVIWFVGYDWFETLTAEEEARLATYLDSGGRLFFSGQDYLYTNGLTDFGRTYLGISSYTEDLTSAIAVGVGGNPVGDGLGPYKLSYPFPNWSDAITPSVPSEAAFRGNHGAPIGLTHASLPYRAVFFSFPFETLDAAAAETVMERIIGWLSWLGISTLRADRAIAASSGTLTYTLSLPNDGWERVTAHLSNVLPTEVGYVGGTLQPTTAVYDPEAKKISWNGDISPGDVATVSYQVTVADSLAQVTIITNVARIGYDEHYVTFDRKATVRVNVPDLSASNITVDKAMAEPGDPLTYTIILRNVGTAPAPSATLSNPVPNHTAYVSPSLSVSGGGAFAEANGVITWTGAVNVGLPITITYGVTITTSRRNLIITNTAYLQDGYTDPLELKATTILPPYTLYFPLIMKEYSP